VADIPWMLFCLNGTGSFWLNKELRIKGNKLALAVLLTAFVLNLPVLVNPIEDKPVDMAVGNFIRQQYL
jgi:hypothetical protein